MLSLKNSLTSSAEYAPVKAHQVSWQHCVKTWNTPHSPFNVLIATAVGMVLPSGNQWPLYTSPNSPTMGVEHRHMPNMNKTRVTVHGQDLASYLSPCPMESRSRSWILVMIRFSVSCWSSSGSATTTFFGSCKVAAWQQRSFYQFHDPRQQSLRKSRSFYLHIPGFQEELASTTQNTTSWLVTPTCNT